MESTELNSVFDQIHLPESHDDKTRVRVEDVHF